LPIWLITFEHKARRGFWSICKLNKKGGNKVKYFKIWGERLVATGKAMREDERGEVNISGILLMGIGMVFLAVGFIMFPIVTDSTDALLDWICTANTSITDATFTGFSSVVGITPLLVLVGFLAAGVFAMYLGVKISKGAAGGTSLNLGTMILLALSMVFIAIALIILPVALEAICSVLSNNSGGVNTGQGLNATYVGLGPILLVTPLLVLISFIGGAIVSGFFGIKKLGAGSMG